MAAGKRLTRAVIRSDSAMSSRSIMADTSYRHDISFMRSPRSTCARWRSLTASRNASTALAISRNTLRLSWLIRSISSVASVDSSLCVMPSMARDSTDTRRTMRRATQIHNSSKASSNRPVVTTSFVT